MKLRTLWKDTEAMWEAIREAAPYDQEKAREAIRRGVPFVDESTKKRDALVEFFSRWVKYGEFVEIEFDTEAGTATVVEVKK